MWSDPSNQQVRDPRLPYRGPLRTETRRTNRLQCPCEARIFPTRDEAPCSFLGQALLHRTSLQQRLVLHAAPLYSLLLGAGLCHLRGGTSKCVLVSRQPEEHCALAISFRQYLS